MRKGYMILALSLLSSGAEAACRSLEGNWSLQTSLNYNSLLTRGLGMSSSIAQITVSGGTITLFDGYLVDLATSSNGGVSSIGGGSSGGVVVGSPGTTTAGRINIGTGTIGIVNPANCRIAINWTTSATISTNNGTGTATTTVRGRGDFVKVTKGYAGRILITGNGFSLPGTFELSPR